MIFVCMRMCHLTRDSVCVTVIHDVRASTAVAAEESLAFRAHSSNHHQMLVCWEKPDLLFRTVVDRVVCRRNSCSCDSCALGISKSSSKLLMASRILIEISKRVDSLHTLLAEGHLQHHDHHGRPQLFRVYSVS